MHGELPRFAAWAGPVVAAGGACIAVAARSIVLGDRPIASEWPPTAPGTLPNAIRSVPASRVRTPGPARRAMDAGPARPAVPRPARGVPRTGSGAARLGWGAARPSSGAARRNCGAARPAQELPRPSSCAARPTKDVPRRALLSGPYRPRGPPNRAGSAHVARRRSFFFSDALRRADRPMHTPGPGAACRRTEPNGRDAPWGEGCLTPGRRRRLASACALRSKTRSADAAAWHAIQSVHARLARRRSIRPSPSAGARAHAEARRLSRPGVSPQASAASAIEHLPWSSRSAGVGQRLAAEAQPRAHPTRPEHPRRDRPPATPSPYPASWPPPPRPTPRSILRPPSRIACRAWAAATT